MKHMKRILSFALVLVMVLSCMPIQALAAENAETAYVAINKTTGKGYESLLVAMSECRKGETVALQKDASEMQVLVPADGILDLNGCTLEAEYMSCFGDLIDSSDDNSGLLKVNEDYFLIRGDNKQLPIKDGTGFRFVEITKINTKMLTPTKFVFQPLFEAAALDLVAKGGDVTGLTVQVLVGWKQNDGYRTQEFVYNDDLLTQFLGSYNAATGKYGKMFTLTLNNVDGIEELSFAAVLASSTKVTISSATEKEEVTGNVTTDANNQVVNQVILDNGSASAVVSTGTQLVGGTNKVTLSATEMEKTTSNVTLGANEKMQSMNVHVEGVSVENTVPILVTLDKLAPEFLNQGNLKLYHVENGETVEMTRVYALSEVDAHNEFYYDIATGTVTMALATFSEIAVVSDSTKAWEGKFDYTWYNASETELTIANADQLAALSAIVGGMNGQTQDSFAGKTVKLIADINLGDKESENNPNIIFYPIGYYNSEGTYERTNTAITSGLRNFEGTFDGNGHTVENFYQNTWEMKGDHNWYTPEEQYYRDGMGLFGRVYGGTIKNLTVKNFSSDGEIATTGTIAAYADFGATFENITIFNCNPRVYNIGNGGIVGCVGWYTKGETDKKVTFTNITVDNSNKISALWGSYDVACGGIVGQYYPTSGQTSAGTPKNAGVHFENCHISAQMDVYNDVCANYQYYAYRYTGMLIGSVRENETVDGHSYPKMDGITASGCTVHFGTWNDYYYCEIIDNTTASYTHDYQMSRLTEIKAIDGTTITYLDGTTGTVPATGRANYVIVDYTKGHGTENATCYHFKDGAVWTHDMGGIQTGIDENGDGKDDLKEDKQHIYLEFNNLVTGYGWGVTTKGVGDLAGVTILDREVADSVEKFEPIVNNGTTYPENTTITIGELFASSSPSVEIKHDQVQVFVSPADEHSTVSGTYNANTTDWTQGTLTFSGIGSAVITITDYFYCTPTTLYINLAVVKVDPEYTTPTGLTAVYGQTLADIANQLPEGFTWENENQSVGDAGTNTFTAKFTPEDTLHYNTVKVDVAVVVAKADPTYTAPGILNATYGQTLADIANQLTEGFAWANENQSVGNAGTNTFTAIFTHENPNYNTVEVKIQVNVTRNPEVKFESKFNNKNFLYRVGNKNTVSLDSLFKAKAGVTIGGNVSVTIEALNGTAASGTYTSNATWTNGTIQFSGTGVVKVTITDNDYCIPTELTLEVVDATNLTSATGTTTGGTFVLLCDVNTSTYVNYWNTTLYGNGFTYSLNGAPTAYNSKQGHGIIITKNATLDNVVFVGDVYNSYGAYTTQENYNAVIDVAGETTIQNCYISGCAAPVLTRAKTTIVNTTLYGGAIANLLIKFGEVTLENVTTANYDDGRELVGMGIVIHTDANETAKLVLKGTLKQYNFVNENNKPSDTYAQTLYNAMFSDSCSKYHFGTKPNRYVNTGLISMTTEFDENDLVGEITGYGWNDVSVNGVNGCVYTQLNTYGAVDNNYSFENDPHVGTTQGAIAPNSNFDHNVNYKEKVENSNDYCYEENGIVKISMDTGDSFSWNTSILSVMKNGVALDYTVAMNGIDYTGKSIVFNEAGDYVVTYTYTDPYNYTLDNDGKITTYSKTYEASVYIAVSVIKETTKHAEFTFGSDQQAVEKININSTTYLSATGVEANGTKWGSMTVSGTQIYFPIVEAEIVKTKDGNMFTKEAEVQAHFYVFDGVITITDYANGGTGNEVIYNSSTQEMPAGLTVIKGKCGAIATNWYKNNDSNLTTPNDGQTPLKVFCYAGSGEGTLGTRNNKVCYSSESGLSTKNRGEYYTIAQYCYTDNAGATYYYYVGYHMQNSKNVAPDYSSGCFAEGTLITLADGTQKPIEQITYADELLAWDFNTGAYVATVPSLIESHELGEYRVINLKFADGTVVRVIVDHGFFDVEANNFVYIDEENVASYIGHEFVKVGENGTYESVELVGHEVTTEMVSYYTIQTAIYNNCIAENMFTLTSPPDMLDNDEWFDYFEIGEGMKYDEAKMQADIEKYGLYTYEDFAEYVTYEQFIAFNGPYLKVLVGRGVVTYEQLIELIATYVN